MPHSISFHTIKLSKKIQKQIGYRDPPLLLSNSEASALLLIIVSDQISQSAIAHHLGLEPASVVTLIDQLEKKGLASRSKDANGDRRKHQITLTPKGQALAKEVEKKTYQLEKYIKKNIPKNELVLFAKTLDKITYLLERR